MRLRVVTAALALGAPVSSLVAPAVSNGLCCVLDGVSRQKSALRVRGLGVRLGDLGVGRGVVAAAGAPPVGVVATTQGGAIMRDEVRGLLEMARLNTVPLGAGLVFIGALGARAGTADPWSVSRVVVATVLTCLVTSGSMMINDYHDYRLGVDTKESKPFQPLVTGAVRPETVKNTLKWLYATHLVFLCCLDSTIMRLTVLGNTLLTYLYSVHIKPRTVWKNVACATVVSMAVALGALAQGGDLVGGPLRAVWRPMAAVAGVIWHREVLMDIKDRLGDARAGLRTIPVAWGVPKARAFALVPLAAAIGAVATHAVPARAHLAAAPLAIQGGLALGGGGGGGGGGGVGKNQGQETTADEARLDAAIALAPLCLIATLVALTF